MFDLDPLLRFWHAQDSVFERVEEHWWGAVVSDARYPRIREANYARVDTRQPVALDEIDSELLPALERAGADRAHVLVFHPEDQTELLVQASMRGQRLSWDLVMEHAGAPPQTGTTVIEVSAFDEAFWRDHRASARLFDITDERDLDQLQAIERDLLIPAGRRWFQVRERHEPVAFGALLVLEGLGYIDHVVTIPAARRRGHAAAITARLAAEAAAAGADRTYLLAEPGGVAARLYRRRGFRPVTQLASWISDRDASRPQKTLASPLSST